MVGVDEYATRKGRHYGTVLVDVETRRPVDLLPDREASSLAAWLAERQGERCPTGSTPSGRTTCPASTPSPRASTATATPSSPASLCRGVLASSKGTSTGSRCSSARCSAGPASRC
ncbi:transposase [Streptomyces sp. Tue 6430]|nr:transposase [Streptomyces sp. Tue 6430]